MTQGEAARKRRLLLVGHGRMGRLVEMLAAEHGFDVAGVVTSTTPSSADWPPAEVAIDFSTAVAVPGTVERLAGRGTSIVLGTTGWQASEDALRRIVAASHIGIVAAPNFAIGVNLFLAVVDKLGSLMAQQPTFGAWIHEVHYAAKRDTPSGTALAILQRLRQRGYTADVPIASTRAGAIPGIHKLGFDAASETIIFTHEARDRTAFARGALAAARWLEGRRGWFSMQDVLGL